MSGIVYSCTLKSRNGGQTFHEVHLGNSCQFKEKLCMSTTCVKINRIPSGPIIEAWGEKVVDSFDTESYVKLHGKYMQYNGLKPRWIQANFRPEHILSNFTIAKDLLLCKIISNRSGNNCNCAMVIDQQFGGFYIDYNVYPIFTNYSPDVVSNWRWIEYVYFIMKMWLLSSKHTPLINYEVLVNYSEQYGDLPAEMEYSIQFINESDDNKILLNKCFEQLKLFSMQQPIDVVQYYISEQYKKDMKSHFENVKSLTFERLELEEVIDNNKITKTQYFIENKNLLTIVNLKWVVIENIIKIISDNASFNTSQNVQNFFLSSFKKEIKPLFNYCPPQSKAPKKRNQKRSDNNCNSSSVSSKDVNTSNQDSKKTKSMIKKDVIENNLENQFKDALMTLSNISLNTSHTGSDQKPANSDDKIDNSTLSNHDDTIDQSDDRSDVKSLNEYGNKDQSDQLDDKRSSNPSENNANNSMFPDCKDPADWDSEETWENKNKNNSQNFSNWKSTTDEPEEKLGIGSCASSIVSSKDLEENYKSLGMSRSSGSNFNRNRRFDQDTTKTLIMVGLLSDGDEDIKMAVDEFLKEVFHLEIVCHRACRVGQADRNMIRVYFKNSEEKETVLSTSRPILRQIRSRVVVREDLTFAEREARRQNKIDSNN